MKFQLTRDFYLVFLDEVWESHVTPSGVISSNTSIQNTNEELEDRGEFKRRYGIVLQLPASFSDTPLEMIDPGLPPPRKYVGHEWIQMMHLAGYRGYRDHEQPEKYYYPSAMEEYETVKMSDYGKKMNVQVGDKVYFEHTSTDMERYMGAYTHNGLKGHMFSIQVNEILCVAKKSPVFINHEHYVREKIYPQGGWIFVELNMESWQSITTPNGVIVKMAPEALPLQGKVLHAQNSKLVGKDVIFNQDADAPVTIDGVEMTSMQEGEILATIKAK